MRNISTVIFLPKEHVEDLVVVGCEVRQQLVAILIGKGSHEIRDLVVILKVVLETDEREHL